MAEIEYIDKLGPIMNLLKYDKNVEHFQVLTHLNHQIIAMFTGNQAGKTASAAMQYVLRVFGLHPIENKKFFLADFQRRKRVYKHAVS
jgi:hypothetical protein